MTKKHFIELADMIRNYNKTAETVHSMPFLGGHVDALADFCASQNPRFNRDLWIGYIAGTRGPGGKYLSAP